MSPPASCTIHVDPRFLANLAQRLDRVASDLLSSSNRGSVNLSSAPPVQRAFDELGRRWDYNRDKLADQLTALAAGFRSAGDAMVQVDTELAAAFDSTRDGMVQADTPLTRAVTVLAATFDGGAPPKSSSEGC